MPDIYKRPEYRTFFFGKYADVPLKDIPLSYLMWLVDNFTGGQRATRWRREWALEEIKRRNYEMNTKEDNRSLK